MHIPNFGFIKIKLHYVTRVCQKKMSSNKIDYFQ